MNFPTTRYTLIHRIATNAAEADWALFLADYWRPICRFAARWGRLNLHDAEDIAAVTLETVLRNGLLTRWAADRRAKLRTLLCAVVRRVLANAGRKHRQEANRVREYAEDLNSEQWYDELVRERLPLSETDAFYEAWAEELLQSAVESMLDDYHREGRGDYFRVLYGRVCEGLSVKDVSELLALKVTDVTNYYRHARSRLETRLRELIRWQVARYVSAADANQEFETEWSRLGEFLTRQGGLEECLRRSYADFNADELREREVESLTAILKNVREYLGDRVGCEQCVESP